MLRQVRALGSAASRAKKGMRRRMPEDYKGGQPDFGGELSGQEKRLTALLRPVAPPPPHSQEEKKRMRERMIKYGKLMRAQHVEMEVRMNAFLRAKWAAIDALPHYRRVEALDTEATVYPRNRPRFTETPPIKGFNSGDITKPS